MPEKMIKNTYDMKQLLIANVVIQNSWQHNILKFTSKNKLSFEKTK